VCTGWRRHIGWLKLQVIFCKRATEYRALWREMTYKDEGSYGSSPHCSKRGCGKWGFRTDDMTHTFEWHDSHTRVTWIVHTYMCGLKEAEGMAALEFVTEIERKRERRRDREKESLTAYWIWSVISSFSKLNRLSSSLGLFCHVPLKRERDAEMDRKTDLSK